MHVWIIWQHSSDKVDFLFFSFIERAHGPTQNISAARSFASMFNLIPVSGGTCTTHIWSDLTLFGKFFVVEEEEEEEEGEEEEEEVGK